VKAAALTAAASLFVAILASVAPAQVQRTFVSGLGDDGNPCSRTAPCRTFGRAISQTNAGGEVIVLDSAGYGPFTISKSISIIAPAGVYAGISVFFGDGIDITASASDTVILRGLTLNNQGSTGMGIVFTTGGTLHIENCVVNGFSSQAGVFFAGAGNLEVKDSIMRGNFWGVVVRTASGAALGTVEQVRLEGNGATGLVVQENSKVTVRNSVASGNYNGFQTIANFAPAELNVENCAVSNNSNIGIDAFSQSAAVTVGVSNSTVTNNGTGLFQFNGASLLSRGNNTVEGNTTDTGGIIGSYTAK
jgi:hypothetical protein